MSRSDIILLAACTGLLAGGIVIALLPARSDPEAEAFAALHYQRCMQGAANPGQVTCTLKTIQLASALRGQAFAENVARAL
jgi:hypothetical protein